VDGHRHLDAGAVVSDFLEEHPVAEVEPRERVDAWASRHFARLPTRGSARRACKRGELLLNGAPVESSRFVKVGDTVALKPGVVHPTCDLQPDVAIADAHAALVVKPAGILVNGNRHRTLEHALPNVLPPTDVEDALFAPRPVHRLDFETMGLVAVARSRRALSALSTAFEERRVHKRYEAIVVGRLEGEGTIGLELDGRPAVSRYWSVRPFRSLKTDWCTRVRLEPVTGRTHQLRRHLQHLGHSILGDKRYPTDGLVFRGNGLFLAAVELDVPHPVDSGARMAAQIDVPHKFVAFEKREERRWARWHGKKPASET
jgi:23S rRNA-/tRNA-specific pseudouridylate synthase